MEKDIRNLLNTLKDICTIKILFFIPTPYSTIKEAALVLYQIIIF